MYPIAPLRLAVLFTTGCLAAQIQPVSAAATGSATTAKPAAASGATATATRAQPAPAPARTVSVAFQTKVLNTAPNGVFYKSGNLTVALQPNSSNSYTYAGNAIMDILGPDPATAPAPQAEDNGNGGGRNGGGRNGGGRNGGGRNGRGGPPAPTGPLVVVGNVNFPKSGNYILYLNAETDGSVVGIPMSDDIKDFPIGSYRFINATGFPLALKILDKEGKAASTTPIKVNDFYVMPFKGTEIITTVIERTDTDPATTISGQRLDPPSPGLRTSVFIVIGNQQQVKKDHANPSFNLFLRPETADSNASIRGNVTGTGGTSTGNRGRNGGGNANGNGGGSGRTRNRGSGGTGG